MIKYGFIKRPTDGLGCGMTMFWRIPRSNRRTKGIMKKIHDMHIGPRGTGKTHIGMLVNQHTDCQIMQQIRAL